MKKSDIYEVAIKILGLYLIISILSSIRGIINGVEMTLMTVSVGVEKPGGDSAFSFLYLEFIPPVLELIITLTLIFIFLFRTRWLVKKICISSDYEESAKLFAEKKEIYQIAITMSSLLLILWTLPDFAFKLKNYIQAVQSDHQVKEYDTVFVAISAVKIFVGIIAIGFSRSISAFFAKEKKKEGPDY